MRKLTLAVVLLAPFAAHAQYDRAADIIAACKHRAEPVAAYNSPRYRQIVIACARTEIARIDANTAAMSAKADCLNRGGTNSSCNR